MASNTTKQYRNQVVYSIFVRNYSQAGTFAAVKSDLNRIRELGVDIIWLLPIHPIGQVNRKGSLGSPYAIQDYRRINPEYGDMEDFKELVAEIHAQGMKCIIDVVYNHTSPDSWLVQNHPEWFYRKPDGNRGNRIGEWTDVVDLDYAQAELWDYQIETLGQWAQIVDGFRCDVAPLIPLEFWLRARREVEKVRPNCIWLSESVEPSFIHSNRARGMISLSDSEIYQAFDICYDYDIFSWFNDYLQGNCRLADYLREVQRQETIYPDNYVKLRYLENHDNARAASIIEGRQALWNWTAFLYFQKGITLLYCGQEKADSNLPSLFDKDEVRWASDLDLTDLMKRLYAIKKHSIFTDSSYQVMALQEEIIYATHQSNDGQAIGIFSTRGNPYQIEVPLADGEYRNRMDNQLFAIQSGQLKSEGRPIIFMI